MWVEGISGLQASDCVVSQTNKRLVSTETVVPSQLKSETQKFGIKQGLVFHPRDLTKLAFRALSVVRENRKQQDQEMCMLDNEKQ